MMDILDVINGIDLNQDEHNKIVNILRNVKVGSVSGYTMVAVKEFESNPETAAKKLKDPRNQRWGILESEVDAINQERARMIRLFEGFYLESVDENKNQISNLSPQEILFIIRQLMIRIKRLAYVLEPDYSKIEYIDKQYVNNKYTQVKGYWINDDGKRVRSLSKNIGRTPYNIEDLVIKLFEFNSNVQAHLQTSGAKFKADLSVNDGKKHG